MVSTCEICNKVFTSDYNYEKHVNRTIPCGQILACDKCNKIFKTKYEYESHMKRKTPCVKTPVNIDIKSIKQKEKTKQKKLQLKIIDKNIEAMRLKKEIKENEQKSKLEAMLLKQEIKEREELAKLEALRLKKVIKESEERSKLESIRLKNESLQLKIAGINNNIEREELAKLEAIRLKKEIKDNEQRSKLEAIRLKNEGLQLKEKTREQEHSFKKEDRKFIEYNKNYRLDKYTKLQEKITENRIKTKQMDADNKISAMLGKIHLENLKTERKMMSPKFLEEKHLQQSREDFVNHIKNEYIDNCTIGINRLSLCVNSTIHYAEEDQYFLNKLYKIYKESKDIKYIQEMIKICFNDTSEYKSIYYNGITDDYYGIFVDPKDNQNYRYNHKYNQEKIKEVKYIDFDRDVMPTFRSFLIEINRILMQYDKNDMRKYARNGFINYIKSEYRNISKEIFEIPEFKNINKSEESELSYSFIEETEEEFEQRYLTYHKDTYKENDIVDPIHDYSTDDMEYKKYIEDLKYSGNYITY